MDRDKRWERVALAYNLIVNGTGTTTRNIVQSLQDSYDAGKTDEFIEPLLVAQEDGTTTTVQEGDVIVFFNFRTDRGRELTEMLSQRDFEEQNTKRLDLHYVTMTNYDETFKNTQVIYDKDNLVDTLGETLSKAGKKQIRIAETEKYPHVTFFFSGGREEPFEGESRLLAPSPKVATYDLQPEMSAHEHTGILSAAVKACETVDTCTKDIVTAAEENGYSVIIIADHGNAEVMINPDGSPNTAHTTNPVPVM